jgi:hypothetical protein
MKQCLKHRSVDVEYVFLLKVDFVFSTKFKSTPSVRFGLEVDGGHDVSMWYTSLHVNLICV